MRFNADESIAVIIDVQEKLFPHMLQAERLENNIATLLEGFNVLNIPTLVTEQYRKGLGETIPTIQKKFDSFIFHEKMCFSCADDKPFLEILKSHNRDNIILAGIEAHVCILQTAIDLIGLGYEVMVIADCISSRKMTDYDISLKRMEQEGIYLGTTESILLELCKESGTDTFKQISRLIK